MHYGLIGFPLGHSFSRNYFTQKFQEEGLQDYSYKNFEIENISLFPDILKNNPDLKGLNVTIPYKEKVIKYLDKLDESAKRVGAVNVIKIENGIVVGFNSDVYGFGESLRTFLSGKQMKALILGSGGASKAVAVALSELNIPYFKVSRSPKQNDLSYAQLVGRIKDFELIINTTPLGTHPNIHQKPDIPYKELSVHHYLFDLIYNPEKSSFLTLGDQYGAKTRNGLEMLRLQAEKSWEIWNSKNF